MRIGPYFRRGYTGPYCDERDRFTASFVVLETMLQYAQTAPAARGINSRLVRLWDAASNQRTVPDA